MSAAIWCKEHAVKTIVHPVYETSEDSGLNALQVYVRNYKQADLTLTGTVRKANLVTQSTKMIAQNHTTPASNRRASTATGVNGVTSVETHDMIYDKDVNGPEDVKEVIESRTEEQIDTPVKKTRCMRCRSRVTPKWWKGEYILPSAILIPGKLLDCSCHPDSEAVPDLNDDDPAKLESVGHLPGCPMNKPVYSCVQERDMRRFEYGIPLSLYVVNDPNKMEEAARTIAGQSSYEVKTFFLCHKCHWHILREPHLFPFDEILRFTRPLERAAWIAGNMRQPSDSLDAWRSHTLSQPLGFTNDNSTIHPADGLSHGSQHSPMTHLNGLTPSRPLNEIHREPGSSGLLLTHQLNGSPGPNFRHTSGPPQLPAMSHSQQNPTITPLLVPAVDNVYSHHAHIPPPPHLPPTNQPRDNPPMVRDRPSTPRESTSGVSGTMSRSDHEGRSASGASASPSLRNLLS